MKSGKVECSCESWLGKFTWWLHLVYTVRRFFWASLRLGQLNLVPNGTFAGEVNQSLSPIEAEEAVEG